MVVFVHIDLQEADGKREAQQEASQHEEKGEGREKRAWGGER